MVLMMSFCLLQDNGHDHAHDHQVQNSLLLLLWLLFERLRGIRIMDMSTRTSTLMSTTMDTAMPTTH
jgi:hypothetical protein